MVFFVGGKHPGMVGVRLCRNYWSCPSCAAAIVAKRREQLVSVLAGQTGSFVTLTVAHHGRDKLKDLLDALMHSWKELREVYSKALKGVKIVRVLEIRRGSRGWHPHLHIALLGVDPASLRTRGFGEGATDAGWLCDAWEKIVRDLGEPHAIYAKAEAQDVRAFDCTGENAEDLAGYFAKELTVSEWKPGESMAPFDILERAAAEFALGTPGRYCAQWHEFEEAVTKRPWLRFSPGMLKTDEDNDNITDEDVEATDGDVKGDSVDVSVIVAAVPASVAYRLTPYQVAELEVACIVGEGETVGDAVERFRRVVSDNQHYVSLRK